MERRIVLSNKFYDKAVIEKALKDYSAAATGRIADDAYTVVLTPADPSDGPVIAKEFSNYVLGLMKNEGKMP